MRKLLTTAAWAATILICIACSQQKPRYIIGVSQCSEDVWRNWQNNEMRLEANLHEGDVKLRFATAYDKSERQIHQIDSLVDSGIQLLIVAPNQFSSVSPAIDRAYDKGIPVIVFERKTNSQKYTAFVSADNYEMGRQMGRYIVGRLKGKGHILEIKGLEGSSPAIERHKGFMEALKDAPDIHLVASLQGDWTEPTAYEVTRQWLKDNPDASVDLVFGANDRSAMGARKAMRESKNPSLGEGTGVGSPLYCGIDGLPGAEGGIRLVRDSLLEASYIYPTHGDRLLQLALDILDGKDYEKETMLTSALVTRENATVLLMASDEVIRRVEDLNRLQMMADSYLRQLDSQHTIMVLALVVIALLVVAIVLLYLYYLKKTHYQQERVTTALWNIPAEDLPQPADETDEKAGGEETAGTGTSLFLTRFKEVVESRMTDSDLSVEDLAAAMNLSRVQLYRKVKAITGTSPVEVLRTARLNRAYQMLLTTDKSVSEVAYDVGFTAPGYFTKCFKDEYGKLPIDVKNT